MGSPLPPRRSMAGAARSSPGWPWRDRGGLDGGPGAGPGVESETGERERGVGVGVREKPVEPTAGPVPRLAHDLRKLRVNAGSPTYRTMAEQAPYSAPTLSAAASGERLPTLPVLLAYVAACGGDPREWERRWYDTSPRTPTRHGRGRCALPGPRPVRHRRPGTLPRQGRPRGRTGTAHGTPTCGGADRGVGQRKVIPAQSRPDPRPAGARRALAPRLRPHPHPRRTPGPHPPAPLHTRRRRRRHTARRRPVRGTLLPLPRPRRTGRVPHPAAHRPRRRVPPARAPRRARRLLRPLRRARAAGRGARRRQPARRAHAPRHGCARRSCGRPPPNVSWSSGP